MKARRRSSPEGGQGIGFGIAETFAAAGANLLITGRHAEKLETAAACGDAQTLSEEAKRIGAAAEHIASTGLRELAQSIGNAAAQGDFGAVKADVEALRREIQSLEALTT